MSSGHIPTHLCLCPLLSYFLLKYSCFLSYVVYRSGPTIICLSAFTLNDHHYIQRETIILRSEKNPKGSENEDYICRMVGIFDICVQFFFLNEKYVVVLLIYMQAKYFLLFYRTTISFDWYSGVAINAFFFCGIGRCRLYQKIIDLPLIFVNESAC